MVTVRIAAADSWRVALSHRLEPRTAGLLTGSPFQGVRLDCGVCTVISSFGSKLSHFLFRRAGASVLITLAVITSGCGSSGSIGSPDAKSSGKLAKDVLKPEQLYKYEGEGKAKRKVEISRQERVKLLREAAEKTE
jgi:hypothetical protein